MVDTISPQGPNDNINNGSGQNQFGNNYYAGFGKPQDVKVNLAADNPVAPSSAPTEVNPNPSTISGINNSIPEVQTTSVQDIQPEPQTFQPPVDPHYSYTSSGSEPVNPIPTLIGIGASIAIIFITSISAYFIVGSSYNKKISEKRAGIAVLEQELNGLKETPAPLEIPDAPPVEPPATVTPTPEPPKVEENNIETPAPIVPTTGQQGMG